MKQKVIIASEAKEFERKLGDWLVQGWHVVPGTMIASSLEKNPSPAQKVQGVDRLFDNFFSVTVEYDEPQPKQKTVSVDKEYLSKNLGIDPAEVATDTDAMQFFMSLMASEDNRKMRLVLLCVSARYTIFRKAGQFPKTAFNRILEETADALAEESQEKTGR
jgi:hypothetical protein